MIPTKKVFYCSFHRNKIRFFVFFLLLLRHTPKFAYEFLTDISPEVANQTVYEGATVFFTCQATGTPILSISWYFNGAPVDKNNTVKYMISESSLNHIVISSTLTVMNAEQSDMGTYTCQASNYASSDTSSGALTVNSKDFSNNNKN